MNTQASLRFSLRALAISSALLLAGAAHAGSWGLSTNVPVQTQYYGSSALYGAPGSQIISTRQVPQTVCRQTWSGSSCTTEYVTVEDNYAAPAPVYVAPAPVYVAPPVYAAPAYGYPGYGYRSNDSYRHHDRHWNNPAPYYRQPVAPPVYQSSPYGGYGGGYGPGVNLRIQGR